MLDASIALKNLIEEAANTTAEGITISDMTSPDHPLIYINEGFERLTCYARRDVLGKNCRFLQGKQTDQNTVDEIRHAIKEGKECTVELLNYRKDGRPFWNRLSINPLRSHSGSITHYVGVQSDITEMKETKERLEHANKRLEQFHQDITAELEQARRAQAFILPEPLPQSQAVRFASKFVPMDQIGGDFFDVVELEEGIFGVLIADVTGHGIPAALLTFMSSNTFKITAPGLFSTANVMRSINGMLYEKMPDSAFVSMFYAIYNANEQHLTYTQAGHPQGFIIRPHTKKLIPLSTEGLLIGILSRENVHFEEKRIPLIAGDKLLLYTDAIIEATDAKNNMLGIDGLEAILRERWDAPIENLLEELYRYGLDFSGKPSYEDDFTMIGFEVL